MEDLSLLTSMALVLGVALIAGVVANHLRLPVIMGYLLAGIIIGPNATGLVSETEDVETMATIGVVLLMFTLGIEFSLNTLRRIGLVSIIGAVLQIIGTGIIGFLLIWLLDRSIQEAVLFAFFVPLSSTIVVLRTLMDRGELGSPHGRIMIGILLIQDLAAVPLIAIIPALGASGLTMLTDVGFALLKAGIFLGMTVILGFWGFPLFLKVVARQRPRELFLLSAVCLCFVAGYVANLFGLSVAIGAFLAGLLVSTSAYTHQVMADIRPLRDIFAVLFFVALGMLADPSFIVENPFEVGIVVVAVMVGKFAVGAMIPRLFKYKAKTNLFVGTGLFQIGEFSFILAALALEEGLISDDLYSLTMITAFITITLTPLALNLISKLYYQLAQNKKDSVLMGDEPEAELVGTDDLLRNHTVICGFGKTARYLGSVLQKRGFSYVVVDIDPRIIETTRKRGIPSIFGDASHPEVLAAVNLPKARMLVITFPDPVSSGLVVQHARKISPRLDIVARAQDDAAVEVFRKLGVKEVVRPQVEAGLEIIRHTLLRFGLGSQEIQHIISRLREEEI
ncbi:MAG: cation:proton antiporter [Dehalococcoidia bacterium]